MLRVIKKVIDLSMRPISTHDTVERPWLIHGYSFVLKAKTS